MSVKGKSLKVHLIPVFWLALALVFHNISAQNVPLDYILHPTPDGIEFYALTSVGNLELAGSLSDFAISGFGTADWMIPDASQIVASPDGESFAFPASRNSGETALFIYDLAD